MEDLEHQILELFLDCPPHAPLIFIFGRHQQPVESLGVDEMFEDQHQQTVTVEGTRVHAQADGDGTAADFIGLGILGVKLKGQDAVERGGAQWTDVAVEIVLAYHLDVALDVDAMQTPSDQHS